MVDFKKTEVKEKLVDVAYREIKEAIVLHTFRPGECLSTNHLATTLKMSRTPIREALNMLASEGLVEIQNGVGIYVKGYTLQHILELYEVRITLEMMAMKDAINVISAECLDDLVTRWLKLKDRYYESEDFELVEVSELDNYTHLALIDFCENEYLKNLLHDVYNQVKRVQYMSAKALGNIDVTINQHFELLEAIRNRDYDAVSVILPNHIRSAVGYIFEKSKNVSI